MDLGTVQAHHHRDARGRRRGGRDVLPRRVVHEPAPAGATASRTSRRELGLPYVFLTSERVDGVPRGGRGLHGCGPGLAEVVGQRRRRGAVQEHHGRGRQAVPPRARTTSPRRTPCARRGGHKTAFTPRRSCYDGAQQAKMEALLDARVRPYVDEHYWPPLYSMGAFAMTREEELGYRPTAGNQGRIGALREPLPCWSAFTGRPCHRRRQAVGLLSRRHRQLDDGRPGRAVVHAGLELRGSHPPARGASHDRTCAAPGLRGLRRLDPVTASLPEAGACAAGMRQSLDNRPATPQPEPMDIQPLYDAMRSLNADDAYKARLSLEQWKMIEPFLTATSTVRAGGPAAQARRP
ncbi:MAG: hypothetical protein MZW92_07785 [Comamonadaceae bacterium]|nr:hypothetical protein [Comamonadaceae bacterium]